MTAALIYLAILVVAFFLLIVLPQRRRMAAHRALVDAMDVGDEIVTTAGIHGTVRRLHEATLELEIAPGVVVTLARGAVSQRRRPGAVTGAPAGEISREPSGEISREISGEISGEISAEISGETPDTPAVDGAPVEPRPPTDRRAD